MPRHHGLLDCTCPIETQHPLNRGLVSEWASVPLVGRNGGKTVFDLVRGWKKPNDGAINGGVTWQGSGRPGGYGAWKFDGSTGYVLENAAETATALTNNFTVCCWVKGTSFGANNGFIAHNALGPAGYTLGERNGKFTFLCGGPGFTYLDSDISPATNTWYHLAAVVRQGSRYLYVNTQQQSGTDTQGVSHAAGSKVVLGRYYYDYNDLYLNGFLNEAAIYNRALSPAEVAALYDQGQRGNPDRWRWIKPITYFTPQATGGLLLRRRRAMV